MNLQNKIIQLRQQTAIKKISLVVTPTGAIVEDKIFVGIYLLKSNYEKKKITIIDYEGKKIEVIDLKKPSKIEDNKPKQENKPADKKKSKDDKATSDVPNASV